MTRHYTQRLYATAPWACECNKHEGKIEEVKGVYRAICRAHGHARHFLGKGKIYWEALQKLHNHYREVGTMREHVEEMRYRDGVAA